MIRAPIIQKEVSPSKSSSQGSDGRPDSGFASEVSDSERSGGSQNEVAMEVGDVPSCSGESAGPSGLYKVSLTSIVSCMLTFLGVEVFCELQVHFVSCK